MIQPKDIDNFKNTFMPPAACLKNNVLSCDDKKVKEWNRKWFKHDAAKRGWSSLPSSSPPKPRVPPPAWVRMPNTCSKPGKCGRAYQACCAGFAAKGFPCTCHLVDGTGKSGGNCGTCGTGYSACCAGFKAKGFPCTCDIQ